MAAGCGGCKAGDSPTRISLAEDQYIIDFSPTRAWQGRWDQPPFPFTPCTDPHTIQWQWRQVYPSVTAWTLVGKDAGTNCNGASALSINVGNGGSQSQLANSATWYSRDFFACDEGVFEMRIARPTCGAAFYSVSKSVVVRIRRTHTTL